MHKRYSTPATIASGVVDVTQKTDDLRISISPNGSNADTPELIDERLRLARTLQLAAAELFDAADDCIEGRVIDPVAKAREVTGNVVADLEEFTASASEGVRTRVVRLADVQPERVEWLWHSRIPFGKLSIIEGLPGVGKSTMTIEIAARFSRGEMIGPRDCGAAHGPGNALFVTFEDGVADTIRPRLDAAGGDASRVYVLTGLEMNGDPERPLILPDDMAVLRAAIRSHDAKLVVIDPLGAALSGRVDSWKDADVRRALAPLARLAEETGAAIVVVRHVTKSAGSNAIVAGGGSIGVIGAARSALLVDCDPDDADRRVLASIKNNLAKKPESLSFHLEDTGSGWSRVNWLGESHYDADALTRARGSSGRTSGDDQPSDLQEAKMLLTEWLTGGPQRKEALLALALSNGVSQRTLERAKKELGIRHAKHGFGAASYVEWALPDSIRAINGITEKSGEHVREQLGQSRVTSAHTNTRQAADKRVGEHAVASMRGCGADGESDRYVHDERRGMGD